MFKNSVNLDIAFTHIITRKRQTLVAALGVMIGIAIFLFMNSLTSGFSRFSRNEIFKGSAHIKIYREDELSKPVLDSKNISGKVVIVNPQITTQSKTLVNPNGLLKRVKEIPFVTTAIAQVNVDVFYNKGKSQLKGVGNGVNILEADAMFNIESYMIAGSLDDLEGDLNGIIIGKGIAEKLNVRLTDDLTVSSAEGVSKILRIKGIFSTGNRLSDQSKSYINISTAQQLVKEQHSYVTTIYANTIDPDEAPHFAEQLQRLTIYKVEPWQITNADILSGDLVRNILMRSISLSILLVAAFGIYNILNMTVMQKINDIAILKATGFSGHDVIKIFVSEAIITGLMGCIFGLAFGAVLIGIVGQFYMGQPLGYFPIYFNWVIFTYSFLLGLVVTFAAGFFPARKASQVDPVEIFRK
jgi:lipoprotein-releasing system permease protein